VVDVSNISAADSAPVHQREYANQANQQWRVEAFADDSHRPLAMHSGNALDAQVSGITDGALIQQNA
jgi:glucosylceramidase